MNYKLYIDGELKSTYESSELFAGVDVDTPALKDDQRVVLLQGYRIQVEDTKYELHSEAFKRVGKWAQSKKVQVIKTLALVAVLISIPSTSSAWSTYSEHYDVPPRVQFDYAAQRAALYAALHDDPINGFWIFFSDYNNWAPSDFCVISYYTHHGLGAWETCNISVDYTPNFIVGQTPPTVPAPAALWLFGSALAVIGFLRRKAKS